MRSQNSARTLGDMLMAVAVMTDSRGLQLDDAVTDHVALCSGQRAAESARSRRVQAIGRELRIARPPKSIGIIGNAYRIREFTDVADAPRATNVGVPERDAYTRLALTVYQERLADARVHAARARILITLPIAGMLIPLLLLIGAPTFHAISAGLGG